MKYLVKFAIEFFIQFMQKIQYFNLHLYSFLLAYFIDRKFFSFYKIKFPAYVTKCMPFIWTEQVYSV